MNSYSRCSYSSIIDLFCCSLLFILHIRDYRLKTLLNWSTGLVSIHRPERTAYTQPSPVCVYWIKYVIRWLFLDYKEKSLDMYILLLSVSFFFFSRWLLLLLFSHNSLIFFHYCSFINLFCAHRIQNSFRAFVSSSMNEAHKSFPIPKLCALTFF